MSYVQVLRHSYFASSSIRRSSATPRRLLHVTSPRTLAPVSDFSELQNSARSAVEPVVEQDKSDLFPWLNEQSDPSKQASPPPTQTVSLKASPRFLDLTQVSVLTGAVAVLKDLFIR